MKNGVNRALVAKKKSLNFEAKSRLNIGGGSSHRFLFALLILLTLGAGQMWGEKYYKIQVVAVSKEGGTTPGTVFACAANQWNNATLGVKYVDSTQYLSSSDTTTGPWSWFSSNKPYIHLHAGNQPGANFLGWYSNAACTSLIKNSADYNYANASISSVEDPSSPDQIPTTTFYALFTSRNLVRYYAKVQFNDPEKHSSYGGKYSNEISKSATSYEASCNVSFSYAASALAQRGYVLTGWSATSPASPTSGTINNLASSYTGLSYVTSARQDSSYEVSTLTITYTTLAADTLFISKDANRGRIKHYYQNFIENAAGDGLESKRVFDEMLVSETAKKCLSYRTDTRIALKAIPEANYTFQGWYKVDEEGNKTLFSTNDSLVISSSRTDTLYAYFNKAIDPNDEYVVGQTGCATFADAIAVANSAPANKVIRPRKEVVTIPSGHYTIPAGVTLLIPYASEQENPDLSVQRTTEEGVPTGAYRTLTLAEGAHLNVYGDIEVSGRQSTARTNGGGDLGVGRPAAPTYGQMIMNEGSTITLNSGSVFRAWGFVTGTGEIDARRGSTVREQFQMMDWRGYSYTARMFSDSVLPLTQYYIQNIEAPTTYHPGSKLLGCAALKASISLFPLPFVAKMDSAGIIGVFRTATDKDAAIFLMNDEDDSEDTWVRKYYDVANDRQVYEINNSAYLGSLELKLKAFDFEKVVNSCEYVLPITNNFKIHLLSGDMTVTQKTVLLPGAEIELEKKSMVTIEDTATLYLYDAEQWGTYVCNHFVDEDTYEFGYGSHIKYRPGVTPDNTVRDISTKTSQGNAKLTVHGTVSVEGRLFTTEGGAAITSTIADAGTVSFASAAPTFSTSHIVKQVSSTDPTYVAAQCVSGLLTNDAGSAYGEFSQTAGTPAGKSFCFIDMDNDGKGEWISLTDDGCFSYDNYGVYYIKPRAYVPISLGVPTPEADHTYRDHYAGTDSIYIKVGACEWWCVYPVAGHPDLFECKHPENHTFYYYTNGEWKEKKFRVEFRNWNDTTLKFINAENHHVQDHYMLPYNSHPQWLSANPTRDDDANYSYTFDGWYPAITADTKVTGDTVFMAKFTATPRQYLITFKDASGVEIETTQYAYGTTPTPPVVDMTGKKWSPAIGAVTGNQVYQQVASTSTYTVIWKNWDGTVLETDSNVESGTATAYNGATPTKAADKQNSYEFAGWSPTPAATVTADAIYTATFTPVAQTYTIKFYQEDGTTQIIGSTQNLAYGAMPVVPEYSKENPAAHTEYTLVWSPLVSAATKDQNYIATFTEKTRQYRVDWKDGDDNIIETKYFDHEATPVYSGVTPTKATANNKAYTFNSKWFLNDAETSSASFTAINGANQVYKADFEERDVQMTVTTAETLSSSVTVETITIEAGGKLTTAPGATITTDVLVIEAGNTASGQLDAALVNATEAYFDWTMNGATGTQSRTWYAVAVPWEVNAQEGIFIKGGRHLVLGSDFDLVWYDGAERAANGDSYACWKYVEDDETDKIMHPGRLYMMYFGPTGIQTVRFAKKSGAAVIYNSPVSVETYAVGTGDNKDGNWNGIANPRTYYASLGTGASFAQVLGNGSLDAYFANPEAPVYTTIDIDASKFIVGQPVFVQAVTPQSVVVTKQTDAGIVNAAPRHEQATNLPEGILARYALHIALEGHATTDNLFIQVAEDEKADTYVIGQDLAKGGVAKTIPQLWINRYNAKLSVNTQALNNDAAEYPLTLFAPVAGEYQISNVQSQMSNEDYTLYLTLNGEAIWNLSNSDYTFTLPQGNTTNYGLRVSAKVPEVATGIDEAIVDAKGETQKVIINNQVFIIRGNNMYSVDGQMVK